MAAETPASEASIRSSRRSHTRSWQFGVDGKEFHYFLSHKKEHSKHGSVPGHVALNLHDSLQLLGFRGWCDVDNLHDISKEGLRSGVEACCCMIVLINDESHLSDWCTFEWEAARELEVPIRVVVDLERGNKAECIAHAKAFPGLLRFQWLELTPKMRREVLGDLLTFLHEFASPNPTWALPSMLQEQSQSAERITSQREKFNESRRKQLSFREAARLAQKEASEEASRESSRSLLGEASGNAEGGDEESGERGAGGTQIFALGTLDDGTPMWYPPLNVLMLLGGLDLNPFLHGRLGHMWSTFVFTARYFCLAVCITRAIYGQLHHGPTYTDALSTLALIGYHIHLLYAPRRLIATLRSPALTKALARTQSNETSAELLDELFSASQRLYYVGCLATGLFLLGFFLGWLPLYWNAFYLAEGASLKNKLFSIVSGTLFAVGIVTLIPLGICIHILSALLMMLSTMSAEAAADSIHPSVAQLGLRRILDQERSEVVGESPYRLWSSGENERRWLAVRLHKARSMRDRRSDLRSGLTGPASAGATPLHLGHCVRKDKFEEEEAALLPPVEEEEPPPPRATTTPTSNPGVTFSLGPGPGPGPGLDNPNPNIHLPPTAAACGKPVQCGKPIRIEIEAGVKRGGATHLDRGGSSSAGPFPAAKIPIPSMPSATPRRGSEFKVSLPGISERRWSLASGRAASFSSRDESSSNQRAAVVAAIPRRASVGEADVGQWTVSDDDARRSMPPLKLTDCQLVDFQRQWSRATQLYQQIQAELRPMHDVFLGFSLLCLLVPLELAALSVTNPRFSLDGGYGTVVYASNTLRVLLLWLMPLLGAIDLLGAARCTFRMRRAVRCLGGLTYARPHDRVLVDHITQKPDLCAWRIGGLHLPVGPVALPMLLAVLAISAVPWAWVRFSQPMPGASLPFGGAPSAERRAAP